MLQPPLWELSTKSLTKVQNSAQFLTFLKKNQMKTSQKHLINAQSFYVRLSIILIIFQLESIDHSLWFFLYLFLKIFYLFKFETRNYHATDFVILLCLYLIFPRILNVLPFAEVISWMVTSLYFLGAASQQYLNLSILVINQLEIVNFSVLLSFSLGRLNKNIKHSKILLAIDAISFIFLKRFKQAFCLLIMLGIIQLICHLDRYLIHTKKKYSHLFQIAEVEQFH